MLCYEEVIPLGFSAENAINQIVNNKFEVKSLVFFYFT